jgi:hypothetical protein
LPKKGHGWPAPRKSPGAARYGGGWTDDMFMATTVLARTGRRPGREQDFDVAARLLTASAARLQRDDGLFNHASDGPAAWGRGNVFRRDGIDRSAHGAARESSAAPRRFSRSTGARWRPP